MRLHKLLSWFDLRRHEMSHDSERAARRSRPRRCAMLAFERLEDRVTPTNTVSVTASASPIQVGSTGDFIVSRTSTSTSLVVTLKVDSISSVPSDYTLGGSNVSFNSSTDVVTVKFMAGIKGKLSQTVTFKPVNATGEAEAAHALQLDLQTSTSYAVKSSASTAAITVAANGLLVNNTNATGDGSLAQAVANADSFTSGGTITFAAAAGDMFATAETIQLSGTLDLKNTSSGARIAIEGPASGVTIEGGGSGSRFSVFTVAANTKASLENMTITNGYAVFSTQTAPNGGQSEVLLYTGGGGGINNSGTLTVSNVTISGNTAVGGGAIFNKGTLTVTDSTIIKNISSIVTDYMYGTDSQDQNGQFIVHGGFGGAFKITAR